MRAVRKGDGMTTIRSYDESTADDFRALFVERFPDGDAALLDRFLSNPARADHPSTGSIAYDENGAVKAILGIVPRVVYHGQRRLLAGNGVAIAVRKDANRDFFSDFIRDSIMAQMADVYFVNTAIPPSRKRTALALANLADGPASCAEIRERAVRSSGGVARMFRKVLAKLGHAENPLPMPDKGEAVSTADGMVLARECGIGEAAFDDFWKRYLKDNAGMVSSRTAEELRWVFGKGLASGEVILLTARREGVLQGYAFCRRTDDTAACWRVVDLIALKNDETVLQALAEAATRFLRRRTRATCLQITGFPAWVQPLLKRLFPQSASFGFNKCIWACLNENAKALCGDWVNAPGWYGCPYDGDMCLI